MPRKVGSRLQSALEGERPAPETPSPTASTPRSPRSRPTAPAPAPPPDASTPPETALAAPAPAPARRGMATENIFSAIGAPELVQALQFSSDKRAEALLDRLSDPDLLSSKSLTTLVRDSGLDPLKVLDAYRDFKIAEAHVGALKRAPKIIQDVADDSENVIVDCYGCGGDGKVDKIDKKSGEVVGEEVCKVCKGAGQVVQKGDKDARDLFFKVSKLTETAPTIAIDARKQSQTNNFFGDMPSMEDFAKKTDRAADDADEEEDYVDAEVGEGGADA